ncbi:RNA polymerase sigma factor [Symbiobacterium thermophilum]|uniref:RNA polymerase ECF-type sigma factor n=1 Tax=Symbiobacterium thermophilum TaxID=2734 RepID=A0A953LED1_SYMTR|nr:sigma-70 family RNA polymerase sigma factor [Symbiobacterium thermophilum]MBY6276380.1 hypothetical protein [Symbiobacterium thermophilum]
MPHWDDRHIHRQLLARDPAGLEALADRLAHKLYRLAQMILGGLGNEQDAEEVVSDALAAAWERAGTFDPQRSSLESWVLMLAKYAALDRRRHLRRRMLGADGEAKIIPLSAAPEPVAPSSDAAALAGEEQARVHAALRRLPPAERELLIRRYFLEEPLTDMARDLGLTRGALDTRLWRARQNLRRLLSDESEVRTHDR